MTFSIKSLNGANVPDIFKNWKTTTAGGLPALSVILYQISIAIDGDPATEPSLTALAMAVGLLFQSIFAKDASTK